jgi:hypothetical protein
MKKWIIILIAALLALCLAGGTARGQGPAAAPPVVKQGLDSIVTELYDNTAFTWMPHLKYEYLYDGCGKTLQVTELVMDPATQSWVGSALDEYYYNPAGLLAMRINYVWDAMSLAWKQKNKWEWLYTPQWKVQMKTAWQWIDHQSQWRPATRDEYHYDLMGRLEQVVTWQWQPATQLYLEALRAEYLYDPAGNPASVTGYAWNHSTSLWVADWRSDHTWNVLAQPLTHTFLSFDTLINGFRFVHRQEYIYNLQLNVGEILEYFWDPVIMHWALSGKHTYTHNSQYPLSTLLLPLPLREEREVTFLHMVEGDGYHWFDAGVWTQSHRGLYHWSPKSVSGIPEASQGVPVRWDPNPATTQVVPHGLPAGGAEVQCYDLTGRLTCTLHARDGEAVDLSTWPRGVYLLRTTVPGMAPQVSRVVVQ